jgi:ribosomal protein L29
MQGHLAQMKDKLQKSALSLRTGSSSGLPNYPQQIQTVRDSLAALQTDIKAAVNQLEQFSQLPAKTAAAKDNLAGSVKTVVEELDNVIAAIGSGAPPADALKAAVPLLIKLFQASQKAGKDLDEFGQSSGAAASKVWEFDQASLPEFFGGLASQAAQVAQACSQLAQFSEGTEAERAAVLNMNLNQLKQGLGQMRQQVQMVQSQLPAIFGALSLVDPQTQQIFANAKKEPLLAEISKPVEKLLEKSKDSVRSNGSSDEQLSEKLTDWQEVIQHINDDNIVLLESGDRAAVVGFDEVYPLARRPDSSFADDKDNTRRVFNGDLAVSGKLLALSVPPLAEVLLVHFDDPQAQRMRQYYSQGYPFAEPFSPSDFSILRDRLEKANLTVTEWNLAMQDQPPPPKPLKAGLAATNPATMPGEKLRPQVMLVLPPPVMPLELSQDDAPTGQTPPGSFSSKHVDRLRNAIEGRTGRDPIPAIFLGGYLWERRTINPFTGQRTTEAFNYHYGTYLKEQWGLDVRTDLRIFQGTPSPTEPGAFDVPLLLQSRLPLSSFTDHAAGRPLASRRFYWTDVCPVMPAKDSASGAAVGPILDIPPGTRDTWAVAGTERILTKMEKGETFRPSTQDGDVLSTTAQPLVLAAEASRQFNGRPGKVIVLGLGSSFVNDTLTQPVRKLKAGAYGSFDNEPPPLGNVDLIVNSAYYLAGQDAYIGAGPLVIKPIQLRNEHSAERLKVVFGLAWPLLFLGVGAVMMILRKR